MSVSLESQAPSAIQNQPRSGVSVRGFVTPEEAIAMAEKLGMRVQSHTRFHQLEPTTRQSLAMALLTNHDLGIVGHDYGNKKGNPIHAYLRSEAVGEGIA